MSKPVSTRDAIAAIVCKHVPPQRICDQGKTCACWKEYALPCAEEIADTLERAALLSPGEVKDMEPDQWSELARTVVNDIRNIVQYGCHMSYDDRQRGYKVVMDAFAQVQARATRDGLPDPNYTLRLAHYWLFGGYPAQALDVLKNALLAAGEKPNTNKPYHYGSYLETAAPTSTALSAQPLGQGEDGADHLDDTCMCGSPMESHDIGSGHTAVSMREYYSSQGTSDGN